MYIAPAIVLDADPDDNTYRVKDYLKSITHSRCIQLGGIDGKNLTAGDPVLVLSDEGRNYVMLMHKSQLLVDENKTMLFMGRDNAIVYDDSGHFRLSNIVRGADGHYIEINRFSLDDEEHMELLTSTYKWMVPGLSTMSGDIDILGFYTHRFITKGRYDDPGMRYRHKVEGTITGMNVEEITDVTPSPVGGVPENVMETLMPFSMTRTSNPEKPYELALKFGPVEMAKVSISPLGDIEMNTGPGGAMTTLHMDPMGNIEISNPLASAKMQVSGQVDIKNAVGELSISPVGAINLKNAIGNISVNPAGVVRINGSTFDASGFAGSLLGTLATITNLLATHIHPTGVGPSGPPITAGAMLAQWGILNGIKG